MTPADQGIQAVKRDDALIEALEQVRLQTVHNWKRYGRITPTPAEHLLVATEEFGEIARAMQSKVSPSLVRLTYQWPPEYNEMVLQELTDTAAVLVAMMVECRKALAAV